MNLCTLYQPVFRECDSRARPTLQAARSLTLYASRPASVAQWLCVSTAAMDVRSVTKC
jgi:hypothetical protein